MHCCAPGVSAPKTALQNLAQALLLARARPGNSPARAVPPRMPPIRRRAWRREFGVARALVNASNLLGSKVVRSFHVMVNGWEMLVSGRHEQHAGRRRMVKG